MNMFHDIKEPSHIHIFVSLFGDLHMRVKEEQCTADDAVQESRKKSNIKADCCVVMFRDDFIVNIEIK